MISTRNAWKPAAAVVSGVALSVLAFPGTASADPGTIKVHAPGTALDNNANEPKQACSFRIAAFGASAGETYKVTFEPQGGSNVAGEPTTATATYTASENVSKNGKSADGRTRIFNPDPDNPEIVSGQYKVTATNVDDSGDRKTKVFRVTCTPGGGPGGGTPTPTPTPTPGGGGGDDGEDDGSVGGVGNPDDEDDGTPGVGGVGTGGGGAIGGGGDVPTVPLLMLTGGAVAAVLGAKRFRKSG